MEMKWRPIRSMEDNPTESGEYWVTVEEYWGLKREVSTKKRFYTAGRGVWYGDGAVLAWMPIEPTPAPLWTPEGESE